MIKNQTTQNGLSDIFRRDVKDVYVTVRENNVDQALRVLKKKMQPLKSKLSLERKKKVAQCILFLFFFYLYRV